MRFASRLVDHAWNALLSAPFMIGTAVGCGLVLCRMASPGYRVYPLGETALFAGMTFVVALMMSGDKKEPDFRRDVRVALKASFPVAFIVFCFTGLVWLTS